MLLVTDNEKYFLELKELINILFAGRKNIEVSPDDREDSEKIYLFKKDENTVEARLEKDGKIIDEKTEIIDFKEKNIYKKLIYNIISENYEGIKGKWGILTGIRPVKIVNELKDQNMTRTQISDILRQKYLLSDEKIKLVEGISDVQDEMKPDLNDGISLYISIPFCPSKCYYCSFFSADVNIEKKFIRPYLEKLDYEIKQTEKFDFLKDENITSIYVGGGTPSSLDAENLKYFFEIINENFDVTKLKEFTFEAGRPDTLDEEKLEIIKQNKVSRISINPQTMNDETLVKIGRKHDSDQIRRQFENARKLGFDNINMDLILGLQDESIEDMQKSIDEIIDMDPDSITIHCLARKRAADMTTKKIRMKNQDISEFMSMTIKKLAKYGYYPYYMYRQKNMLENGENIGFVKDKKYSYYNVAMMDELQTVIGFGAGASSKIITKDKNLVKRVPNYKDIRLYISDIDKMIKRKEDAFNE